MTLRETIRLHGTLPALMLAGLLVGCDQPVSGHGTEEAQPSDNPVRYVKVVQQSIPDALDLPAKVQADPTKVVRIFPPTSGRVVAIEVKPGDHVRRGQTLAVLNSSDVASAKSDYTKANIEAERATRAMERQKRLFEHGAAAEKDYIDARAQAEAARAELERTRERLELLNISPSTSTDDVPLVAPATGVVLDVSAAAGEFSKSLESANPLVTIADLNTVWIVGDVYEKDVAKLARGKQVSITLQAYPNEQWKGRIDAIAGALDPTTRTLKVRVAIPNPDGRLKPEMFGTIHVQAGTRDALVVPSEAVIREGNTTAVFVNNSGKPEQRTVTVGQNVNGNVEVVSGLHAGDEVAAAGAELLKGLND